MRRTLWVFPVELAAVVQAACTDGIALRERRRLEKLLANSGIADGAAWLDEIGRATLEVLSERGEAAGAELSRAVPGLSTPLDYGEGRWGGEQPATSRVLFQLAAEQRIIRGRPRGSWTSSQYRWGPFDSWFREGLPDWPTEAAQAELARRWLSAFGPATVADLKWWTGWTLGETRRALARCGRRRGRAGRRRPGGRARRRPRTGRGAETVGGASARARPDDDGLERARLVPRRARAVALRQQRERRADRLGGRAHRRRLGASARTARSSTACSRTSARRRRPRSNRPRRASPSSWEERAWPGASPRRWSASSSPKPLRRDELRAQLVALVGQRGFVVQPVAAAGEG